jgi:hypothetical protein
LNFDFITAQQWYIQPTHLPGSKRWKFGIEILGDGKDGACDVFGIDSITANDKRQKLASRFEDCFTRIGFDGRCTSNAAASGSNALAILGVI